MKPHLKALMQKPLILGASVSGDYFVDSPGKLLALKFTELNQIKKIAFKGKPANEILKSVTDKTLADRSVVIAIDLFFWDSFAASPDASLKEMKRLIDLTSKRKIPIILGEIPNFSPSMQKQSPALSKKMRELCSTSQTCGILPLNLLLQKTLVDGYLMHRGKRYDLKALLPDGLHIAQPASEFLADEIEKILIQTSSSSI